MAVIGSPPRVAMTSSSERSDNQAGSQPSSGGTEVPTPRWLVAVWGLLVLASLFPIWAVKYQPLPDHAEHLSTAAILHHYHHPQFEFERYYTISLGLVPYWGYYFLTYIFALATGIDIANRIVLSFYVIGFPIGFALLAKQLGRSPMLGLLVFPTVWNYNFLIGFTPFCVGLAMLPFALILYDRFCQKPSWTSAVFAILGGIATFFGHLLPWGMYIGATGLIGLCHAQRTARRLFARFLIWLIPVAAGVHVMLNGRGLAMGSVRRGISWAKRTTEENFKVFYDFVWNGCVGHEDELLIGILLLAWIALFFSQKRSKKWQLSDFRAECCFLVAIGAYFILPRSITEPEYWWGVNIRFATMACAFAALLIRGPIVGWRQYLLIPVAVAGLGFAIDTTYHWVQAARFARGFDYLAKFPGPGSRVLMLLSGARHDPEVRQNYMQCYYEMYQVYYGGYMPWNFDAGFPIAYRVRYPAPGWRAMDFQWDLHARYYDYLLIFEGSGGDPRHFFRGHEAEIDLVERQGKWTLWRRKEPRVDLPEDTVRK